MENKLKNGISKYGMSSVTYPEIWRSHYGDVASPRRDTASPEGDAASP
jgi:hypothetical protein